jgi:3-dehydroquinate dehydratase-2
MLGSREPEHYGKENLNSINEKIKKNFPEIDFEFFQGNSEADIINHIHNLKADYIVINPAAFTHTSVAIRDAIKSINIKFYEVHLSNVYAREEFRHKSYFSDIAEAVICGLGSDGYIAAINHIVNHS